MRRIISVLMTAMMLLSILPGAEAENTLQISVDFPEPGNRVFFGWEFPYADAWFTEPSAVFRHSLARGSAGLAVSAFKDVDQVMNESQNEKYLGSAGFEDIRAFGYDQPNGTDTLSGIIGRKKINDFTLVAIAGAGVGYGAGWAGNLRLGTGTRHEGFEMAAAVLKEQLESYLADYPAEGPVKLWVTGYSRSAAAGNLAAGDWIESGKFEDVYAYFFACPRNTTDPREYSGIFNICGTQDYVTRVPMEAFGFGRNGRDLFLPSQETAAGNSRMKAAASAVYKKLTGTVLYGNPWMNLEIYAVTSLLAEMFPTREMYVSLLQDQLIESVGEAPSVVTLAENLISSLMTIEAPEGGEDLTEYLVELMGVILYEYTGSGLDRMTAEGYWNPDEDLFVNAVREHLISNYISWLFADLPAEEVFTAAPAERVLFLNGNDGLTVYRGDQPQWSTAGGESRKMAEDAAGIVHVDGSATVIILPTDDTFRLSLQPGGGSLQMLEIQLTPARTLCDSCRCMTAEIPQEGMELTAAGTEPLTMTEGAHGETGMLRSAETAFQPETLIGLIALGFYAEPVDALFSAAFAQ